MRRAKRGEDANALVGNLELAQVALVLAVAHLQHRKNAVDPATELDEAEEEQVLAENRDRRAAEIELAARNLGHLLGEYGRDACEPQTHVEGAEERRSEERRVGKECRSRAWA